MLLATSTTLLPDMNVADALGIRKLALCESDARALDPRRGTEPWLPTRR